MMAGRWVTVFQELSHRATGEAHAITVQPISTTLQMDCVLIGDIAVQEPQSIFAGLKETSAQRLSLRLMTTSGVLLWRTELPYRVVRGAKNLDEAMATKALLTHVRTHENTIALTGLGTIEVALQNVERPMAQVRD